ncbi:hypothetical protein [Luteimonas sp. FCS-9]|uniref:hypothetical protein n=1 Tax=Luteimonas sp. FCS-9 TaxID=1547516 RepID=UPI00063E82B4|nr:hypothetical protein [Luteimonas sp. FCS-9]KLJ02816.1 hypothetical protein WQ56_00570 [Luteimonas sp. FCS-9]
MTNANMVMIQVEATPQLIRDQLSAWAERNRAGLGSDPFPHAAGDFMRFEPGLAAALEVDPQNPVLIISVGENAPQGLVAFYNRDGLIQSLHVTGPQLVPLEDAPAPEVPGDESDEVEEAALVDAGEADEAG